MKAGHRSFAKSAALSSPSQGAVCRHEPATLTHCMQALWQLQSGPLLGVEPRLPAELAALQASFATAPVQASLAMLSPRLVVLDAATGKFQPAAPSTEALHAGMPSAGSTTSRLHFRLLVLPPCQHGTRNRDCAPHAPCPWSHPNAANGCLAALSIHCQVFCRMM